MFNHKQFCDKLRTLFLCDLSQTFLLLKCCVSVCFVVNCRKNGFCIMSPVSCILYYVSCLTLPVSSLTSPVSRLLSLVSHLLSHVSCPSAPSRLLSHVSCLKSLVSRLLSHVSCLMSPVLRAMSLFIVFLVVGRVE